MHLVLLRRYVLETVETRSLLLHQSIWYTLESRRTIVSEGMVKSVFACRKDLKSFSSIWGGSTRQMKYMYTCIYMCVCSHVFIYVFISIYVFVCVCVQWRERWGVKNVSMSLCIHIFVIYTNIFTPSFVLTPSLYPTSSHIFHCCLYLALSFYISNLKVSVSNWQQKPMHYIGMHLNTCMPTLLGTHLGCRNIDKSNFAQAVCHKQTWARVIPQHGRHSSSYMISCLPNTLRAYPSFNV